MHTRACRIAGLEKANPPANSAPSIVTTLGCVNRCVLSCAMPDRGCCFTILFPHSCIYGENTDFKTPQYLLCNAFQEVREVKANTSTDVILSIKFNFSNFLNPRQQFTCETSFTYMHRHAQVYTVTDAGN